MFQIFKCILTKYNMADTTTVCNFINLLRNRIILLLNSRCLGVGKIFQNKFLENSFKPF